MNTTDDLLNLAQILSNINDSNSHYFNGIVRNIEKTGKQLQELKISELITIVEDYHDFYNLRFLEGEK